MFINNLYKLEQSATNVMKVKLKSISYTQNQLKNIVPSSISKKGINKCMEIFSENSVVIWNRQFIHFMYSKYITFTNISNEIHYVIYLMIYSFKLYTAEHHHILRDKHVDFYTQ